MQYEEEEKKGAKKKIKKTHESIYLVVIKNIY